MYTHPRLLPPPTLGWGPTPALALAFFCQRLGLGSGSDVRAKERDESKDQQ